MVITDKTINNLINSLNDLHEVKPGLTIKDISYNTLVRMGVGIVEPLTEHLKNNHDNLQKRDINQGIASILLDMSKVYGNDIPFEIFKEAANSRASVFRLEAIRALGYFDNNDSYDIVVNLIKNENESYSIKSNAVSSFGDLYEKYGSEDDFNALDDLFDSLEYVDDEDTNKEIAYLKNNIIYVIDKLEHKVSTIGEHINMSFNQNE